MPAVKSSSDTAKKWARVTPQRSEDYVQGVKNPKKDWAKETQAAEGTYKTAVTQAANEGRFGKGVAKKGTPHWQEKTLAKGQERWGPGVAIAQNAYEQGVAPYLDEIGRTDVGPRYPKGDPRNIDRVRKITAALHKKKIGG